MAQTQLNILHITVGMLLQYHCSHLRPLNAGLQRRTLALPGLAGSGGLSRRTEGMGLAGHILSHNTDLLPLLSSLLKINDSRRALATYSATHCHCHLMALSRVTALKISELSMPSRFNAIRARIRATGGTLQWSTET